MAFATARGMFCENPLTRKRSVASASSGGIPAHIPVCVSDVVPILFVEGFIGDELERLPPEDKTFLHAQTYAFEKESILQSAKVFQVAILT